MEDEADGPYDLRTLLRDLQAYRSLGVERIRAHVVKSPVRGGSGDGGPIIETFDVVRVDRDSVDPLTVNLTLVRCA